MSSYLFQPSPVYNCLSLFVCFSKNMQPFSSVLFSQHRELTSTKTTLEEELKEVTRLLEEKREQLKKSKEQASLVEVEIETLRQELKKKEKMVRRRILKDSKQNGGCGGAQTLGRRGRGWEGQVKRRNHRAQNGALGKERRSRVL